MRGTRGKVTALRPEQMSVPLHRDCAWSPVQKQGLGATALQLFCLIEPLLHTGGYGRIIKPRGGIKKLFVSFRTFVCAHKEKTFFDFY